METDQHGGIQDGWRNTGWLVDYRMVGGIQDV